MRQIVSKVWDSFFGVVVTFVVAVVAGTAVRMAGTDGCPSCAVTFTLTLWFTAVSAHQPIVWTDNAISRLGRFGVWLVSALCGIAIYLVAEVLAAFLFMNGGGAALSLGFASNILGIVLASLVSAALVRRFPPTRGEYPKREPRQDRPSVAVASPSRAFGRAWLAISGVLILAAVGIGGFWVGQRSVDAPKALTEVQDIGEGLRLVDGGHPSVAPVAVVSVDQLVADYRENEIAAASKYENPGISCRMGDAIATCRFVQITGVVQDIRRDEKGGAHLTLGSTSRPVSVDARFGRAEEESLNAIRRGDRLSISCMVNQAPNAAAGISLSVCGIV